MLAFQQNIDTPMQDRTSMNILVQIIGIYSGTSNVLTTAIGVAEAKGGAQNQHDHNKVPAYTPRVGALFSKMTGFHLLQRLDTRLTAKLPMDTIMGQAVNINA